MKRNVLAGLMAVTTISFSSPLLAADDAAVGILAGLGLTAASGKTELADGAGSLEGTALTIAPAVKVGELIGERALLASKAYTNRPIALVEGSKQVDLAPYRQADARIKRLETALPDLLTSCKIVSVKPPKPSTGTWYSLTDTSIKTGAVDLAAAVIGALKVDTSIKAFDVSSPNMLLINSVSTRLGADAILPDEVGSGDYEGRLANRFNRVSFGVETYIRCVALKDKNASDIETHNAAALRAAIDAMTANKDVTPSLIESAIALEFIAQYKPLILRVEAMKTGGNIITRSNIFLQFGFPGAVTIRGGMVATWRLSDPDKGYVVGSGTIACLTREKSLTGIGRSATGSTEVWCSGEDGKFTKS